MAYSREYYEAHKDQLKEAKRRYESKNREKINAKKREWYNALSDEEREEYKAKLREKRAKDPEIARLQYRIDYCKRYIKQYEHKMFMLKMQDTWDSSDYKYSDELQSKIMKYKNMIKELEELKNGTRIEK